VDVIYDSLMISDVEHHMPMDHLYIFFLKNIYLGLLPILKIEFFFLLLSFWSFLYILNISLLSDCS
jgi:hypothetical protein